MVNSPRIYIATDPTAAVRVIANMATSSYIGRSDLAVSYDGYQFNTVLYTCRQRGPGYFTGIITQPALGIEDISIDFADGKITYDGKIYILDEDATVGEIVTKPIMRVLEIVSTHAGYYVVAQNQLDGRSYDYLNGQPLVMTGGFRARGVEDDLIVDSRYTGHRYLVRGDHMDTTRQTATFDGRPAELLNVQDYAVTFPNGLSTARVKKK